MLGCQLLLECLLNCSQIEYYLIICDLKLLVYFVCLTDCLPDGLPASIRLTRNGSIIGVGTGEAMAPQNFKIAFWPPHF